MAITCSSLLAMRNWSQLLLGAGDYGYTKKEDKKSKSSRLLVDLPLIFLKYECIYTVESSTSYWPLLIGLAKVTA